MYFFIFKHCNNGSHLYNFVFYRLPHSVGCDPCPPLPPHVCDKRHLWHHSCRRHVVDGRWILSHQHSTGDLYIIAGHLCQHYIFIEI